MSRKYYSLRKDHGDEQEVAMLAEDEVNAMEEALEFLGWEVLEVDAAEWERLLKGASVQGPSKEESST